MKLSVLLVDDGNEKSDKVRSVIQSEVGQQSCVFDRVSCANEAVTSLRTRRYDLAIVDLNLPLRPNEGPVSDGGLRLLRQVSRGTNGIRRPTTIIGLTAYENLSNAFKDEFNKFGWLIANYSQDSTVWEEIVVHQCNHILESLTSAVEAATELNVHEVCIVTALVKTELEAVLSLPYSWENLTIKDDATRYSTGTLRVGESSLRIVAAACPEMGNPASAMLTTKMIASFRPTLIVMVGVCAGISAKIGEIVVAESSLHHDSGKWTEGNSLGGQAIFQPQPRYREASNKVIEALRSFSIMKKAVILGLPSGWQGSTINSPSVHFGPVASGAAVIENSDLVANLKFRDRKIAGLEMESYGFYLGASESASRTTEHVMIKGVCDNAVPPKTDDWQYYAAFISARFVDAFLRSELESGGGIFQ